MLIVLDSKTEQSKMSLGWVLKSVNTYCCYNSVHIQYLYCSCWIWIGKSIYLSMLNLCKKRHKRKVNKENPQQWFAYRTWAGNAIYCKFYLIYRHQPTYMKYKLINIVTITMSRVVFVGSDFQQLPLPHGGHHIFGVLCDVFCSLSQENHYVHC